jgi:two-component system, OmpR family, sensor histidine kinase MprB
VTLRSKIALALAVLAGLAVLLVATASYVATEQRLRQEVDEGLAQNAARLRALDGRVLLSVCAGQNDPRPRGPLEEIVARGTVVQCVGEGGAVLSTVGAVRLPVDATDEALAVSGSGSRVRSVEVDGDPYRVQTVALPGGGAVQIARGDGESQRVLAALRRQLLAIGVVVIAAGALAGWWIARRATRPLVQLTDAAEEVADTGRLDVELPPAGADEPGRLARSFASMLEALQRSRRQQQQLVQDAGHELRTPLTSLRTNIETLARYPDLPPDARDAVLRDLDTESRELSALVDELVQLATEAWADEELRPVDLEVLVGDVARRAARRSGRTVSVAAVPTTIEGRPRDLARAVGNLVDNALKFSPPDTPVEVRVEAPGRVIVRDHGPGVPVADRERVFERFYRSPDARSLPGSGLGLAIVARSAEAHGGTVHVTDATGGGAEFTLDLPPAPPTPRPASQPPA